MGQFVALLIILQGVALNAILLVDLELALAVKYVHVNHANHASYQESDSGDGKAKINAVEIDALIGGTQLVDGTKVQSLAGTLSIAHRHQKTS